MPPRSAFVTGATGFVGLTLVEELIGQGWQVTALHRPSSQLKYLKRFEVDLAEGDITAPETLAAAIPRNVDAVFHVAGDINMWRRHNALQDRINIDGTRHVVRAALQRGAGRLVHTSSISAYGLHKGRIDEQSEQRGGRSFINYQRSKFRAEKEVRRGIEQGLDAVILNPASIIGAYDTSTWARLFRQVWQGTLPGVPPGRLSFCHSRQVARAHLAAFEKGRCGENYLLGGTDASFLELIRIIGEISARRVPSRPSPAWLLRWMGRLGQWRSDWTGKPPRLTPEAVAMVTREMFCDCSKARRELGFQVVDLRTMVQECFQWLSDEGLLDS
ncbi:MAG: SDR family oxidoreductase [Acidobacteriota bacterium]